MGRPFELPPGVLCRLLVASSLVEQERGMVPLALTAGEEHVFTLFSPSRVLTLEAAPAYFLWKGA